MKKRFALSIVFLLAFFLLGFQSVKACKCERSNSPCTTFQYSDAVFTASVTEITKSENQTGSRIKLNIDEAFKGVASKEEIIEGGGVCDFGFEAGKSYLVYARRDKATNLLDVFLCSGTKLLENAAQDLEFIKMMTAGKRVSSVYGKVLQPTGRENPRNAPLSKIKMVVVTDSVYKEGEFVPPTEPERERETMTGNDGAYRFDDLPSGKHRLKIILPADLTVWQEEIEFSTGNQSCAEYGFNVLTDGRISGKIVSATGEPLARITVRVSPLEYKSYQYIPDGQTDKDGNFEIKGIPPGKYKILTSSTAEYTSGYPFPTLYYPAAFHDREAKVIELGPAEKVRNIDFKLPAASYTKKIQIEVFWEDGAPITSPSVYYKVSAGMAETLSTYIQADGSGLPTLTIFSGFNYKIYASGTLPDGRSYETDEATVTAENAGDVLKLKARLRR